MEMAVPHLVAWARTTRIVEPLELHEQMLACARAIVAEHDLPVAVSSGN
jgi:hypothetical protein